MDELEKRVAELIKVSNERGVPIRLTSEADQMLPPQKGGPKKKYCVWYRVDDGKIQRVCADYEEVPRDPANSFEEPVEISEFLRLAREDPEMYADVLRTAEARVEAHRRPLIPKGVNIVMYPYV